MKKFGKIIIAICLLANSTMIMNVQATSSTEGFVKKQAIPSMNEQLFPGVSFLLEMHSDEDFISNMIKISKKENGIVAEETEEVEKWWTQEEEDLLVQVVHFEMGSDSAPDEAQQLVAAVIINRMRMKHPSFPDTIKDVIYAPGAYSCANLLGTGNPTERCRENVLKVLNEEVTFPDDVVWQSSVPQCAWNTTVKIYKVFDTQPYKTYFCHYGDPIQ